MLGRRSPLVSAVTAPARVDRIRAAVARLRIAARRYRTLPTGVCWLAVVGWLAQAVPAAEVARPRVLEASWHLELVAQEPEIVTPIAMTFDAHGRLLVVESHTHFRPDDYDGPATDRIRALADTDGDGRLDRWSTFYKGGEATMGLARGPEESIIAVRRSSVVRLRDTRGDGQADDVETLIKMETTAVYPHNGLSGLCFVPPASLYLGVGENRGEPYTLVGQRGGRVSHGAGQGGTVYRYDLDPDQHTELRRFAGGFWNPFALCQGPEGELFAVDNDPDASPPCRLIHVLPAGDYGFKYQYGRAGTHPLQAWDGQLPGTLPMICGVGEAPSAVVYHRGRLWVTSWGDHTIERYELAPQGGSFTAERTTVVQGDTDFRPVGMAVATDGSIYFSDWVDRSYTLHHQGRIWRLRPDTPAAVDPPTSVVAQRTAGGDASDRQGHDVKDVRRRQRLIADFAAGSIDDPLAWRNLPDASERLMWLEGLRWGQTDVPEQLFRAALRDESADVRLYAVRWITDQHFTQYQNDVARLLEGEIPHERYYLAVLAAIDWLARQPQHRGREIADDLLARELRNDRRSPALRAMALGLISPDHQQLTPDFLRRQIDADHPELRTQAVRTLAMQTRPERVALLVDVARDRQQPAALRADAVAGLASAAADHRPLLEKLTSDRQEAVANEAARMLRLVDAPTASDESMPATTNIDAWLAQLDARGDRESGRRLFFSAVGARCGACHQHAGRGGSIGPELTHIGRHRSRRRLVESILQPSAEIAPRYVPWILETQEGRVLTGLRLPKGGDDGKELYADSDGRQFTLTGEEIAARNPADVSIMPSGLEKLVTIQDLRDLLAFLTPDGS